MASQRIPTGHVQAVFGPRAQKVWDDMSGPLTAAQRVLLDEACRMTDRLDRLDSLILVDPSCMAEARLTAGALRQLLTDLAPAVDVPSHRLEASTSDELKSRRAQRLATSTVSKRSAS